MRAEIAIKSRVLFPIFLITMSASGACAEDDDRLAGDWGGVRTRLQDMGVGIELDSTHFYQGLLEGSGNEDFEYAGRLDLLVDFDTARLGLWKGGVIRTHTEYRYGDLAPTLGGALLANNTGLVLPTGAHEDVVITSLHLAQQIGDRVTLMLGRFNASDLLANDPFFGGMGNSRFMHMAFAAPPSGVTPAVFTGAVASVRSSPVSWTFMVFDPDDRTHDAWPDDLFHNGVNVSVTASYAAEHWARGSSVTVTGTWSGKDGANLGELLLPPDLQTGNRDHSWFLGVQIAHLLKQPDDATANGWGIYLKVGASDGNPNPFQASLIGGLGGKGLFASRPQDAFGIGFFHVDFSDELQSSLSPLVTFEDDQGVEAFYSFRVTNGLYLTADLQYVNPGLGATDDAFVAGVRARVVF